MRDFSLARCRFVRRLFGQNTVFQCVQLSPYLALRLAGEEVDDGQRDKALAQLARQAGDVGRRIGFQRREAVLNIDGELAVLPILMKDKDRFAVVRRYLKPPSLLSRRSVYVSPARHW